MCDSALHQVLEILDAQRVFARDVDGRTHQVSLLALEGGTPDVGTWLIVHSGYAIDRVDEQEAGVALAALRLAKEIDERRTTPFAGKGTGTDEPANR